MRWKWILLAGCGAFAALMITTYVILSTYNFNSLKPEISRRVKEATGRELTFGGNIRLKFGLTPSLVANDVSFQNAPWGSRPEMAKIKQFEAQVALLPLISGNIDLKRLVLVDPVILIETDKTGKPNFDFGSEKKEASERPKREASTQGGLKLPALVINEFQIEKGTLTYVNGQSHKSTTVSLDSVTASSAAYESPVALKLKGLYLGEPFEVEGSLIPLAALTGTERKPWPVNLTAKAFAANLSLQGTVTNPLSLRGIDLRFELKGNDLATLGGASGNPLPLKGPYSVSGHVSDPAPKGYKISDLKLTLDNSDAAGTLEANLAGQRPTVNAVLTSEKLDIRSMVAESAGSTTAKTTSKDEKTFLDRPLPLGTLGQVDANVKIEASQLLLPGLSLSNVSVAMDLRDGRLLVKPFKALVAGGALDAQLDLQEDGRVGVLGVIMKIDHLDLGRMLKEMKHTDPVEGVIDADVDVRGRGDSIDAMIGSLNGKTVVAMSKGKIHNKYIDLLGADISSSLMRLLSLSPQELQYTTVNCFVGGFSIKDGLAETTALVLDTDQMSVIGDGEINLRTEKLDVGLNSVPKGGIGTSATGKVTANLGELVKAFRLTGTLAHPSRGIDTTQTALTVGKMVGGTVLMGPVGLIAPFITSSGANKNLCPTAIEAGRKGIKMSALAKQEKKGMISPAELPEAGLQELGKGLKKLFGK